MNAKDVERLLDQLNQHVGTSQLLADLRDLKQLSRDTRNCEPLFTAEGVTTLTTTATSLLQQQQQQQQQLDSAQETMCELLTVINNVLLHRPQLRIQFDDDGLLAVLAALIQSDPPKDAVGLRTLFLTSRLLTLMIGERFGTAQQLVDNDNLPARVATQLETLVSSKDTMLKNAPAPFDLRGTICEILKVALVLATLYPRSAAMSSAKNNGSDNSDSSVLDFTTCDPEAAAKFTALVQPTLTIISDCDPSSINASSYPSTTAYHAVNLLMSLTPSTFADQWQSSGRSISSSAATIANILSSAVVTLPSKAFDTSRVFPLEECDRLIPTVFSLLILAKYEHSVKVSIRDILLPPRIDMTKLPEAGSSVDARLIQLLRTPLTTGGNLAILVGDLIYELCDNKVASLVRRIGYGNASSYILARGIKLDQEAFEATLDSTTTASSTTATASGDKKKNEKSAGKTFDPVTGVINDETLQQLAGDDMTEEEKLREAERLTVLFERLNKTGIISAEHPLAKAIQEGMLEARYDLTNDDGDSDDD